MKKYTIYQYMIRVIRKFDKNYGITIPDNGCLEAATNFLKFKYFIQSKRNIRKNLIEKCEQRNRTFNNTIDFVIEHFSTRLIKICKVLKNNGIFINCIVNKYSTFTYSRFWEELKPYCDNIQTYISVNELSAYLLLSNASVAHFFTSWLDLRIANSIIRSKSLFKPIVIERYDIVNGLYSIEGLDELKGQEKYLLESADAIIAREYSLLHLKKNLRFNISGFTMIFLDYVYDAISDNDMGESETMSFCYVGGVVTEQKAPNNSQACFLDFAEKCKDNKCHFHVYPSELDRDTYEFYLTYENSNPYFHLHEPVEYSKLYKEISKYDYGVFLIKSDYASTINRYKYYYAGANKLFDYLAAGLPIVAAVPVQLTRELEKDNLALRWTIDEFDFDRLKRERILRKKNVLENRGKWLMSNHIPELIEFYKKVAAMR